MTLALNQLGIKRGAMGVEEQHYAALNRTMWHTSAFRLKQTPEIGSLGQPYILVPLAFPNHIAIN